MRLHVLGSNGAYPTAGRPASGYLVTAAETSVWIDAGPGTFMRLLDLLSPAELSAVVVSHIHPDHSSDLFAFYHWMAYGPSGRIPVPVFVPEAAADHLGAFVRAGEDHLFNMVLDFRTVDTGDEALLGDMILRFAAADHSVPALAVRLEADGASVTYSGDTGPGGGLTELAAGTDVLLCEATYQGPPSAREYPYHITAIEAGEIGRRAGARRLILTHLSPTLDPQRSIAEAETVFPGPVEAAVPGSEYPI